MELTIDRHLSSGKTSKSINLIFHVASCTALKTVLLSALALAGSGNYLIAVIKTQFEVSKGMVERGEVVSTPDLYSKVTEN
jgi:predicted rRNA methylase YqxC with S4 and FtsJ domains